MPRATNKTPEMRRFEEERGERLEVAIKRLYDQGNTPGQIADALGVSRQTFYVWMRSLGATYSLRFASEEAEQPVG